MKFKCSLKLRPLFKLKFATMGHHSVAFEGIKGSHLIEKWEGIFKFIFFDNQ